MDNGIVSVRYARALLAFARESHEADTVYAEMKQLSDSYLRVPQLTEALLNPTLGQAATVRLLRSAAGATTKCYERFVALVIENKRISLMPFIAHAFLTLYRKEQGLISGKLIVATEPSEAIVERMKRLVAGRTEAKVDFNVEVKPDIIGGFILEYDTYRLDASVKGRLAQLKRVLSPL